MEEKELLIRVIRKINNIIASSGMITKIVRPIHNLVIIYN